VGLEEFLSRRKQRRIQDALNAGQVNFSVLSAGMISVHQHRPGSQQEQNQEYFEFVHSTLTHAAGKSLREAFPGAAAESVIDPGSTPFGS
jgi:hypothetical protein